MGALALALCATLLLALSLAVPAEAATRAKLGEIPAAGGAGAGALLSPRELAVNRTGAGGVGAGDVYVLDRNNRVSEFTATGTFVRAFGYDVVASGEHDTGANEVQKVIVNASGGKFALTYEGKTTGAIGGRGTWTISSTTITITTQPTNGSFAVGQRITGATSGAGLLPTGTEIIACSPSCGAPTSLTISKATTTTKNTPAQNLTAHNIPYNASAAEVEAALNGLSTVGAVGGSVAVTRVEKTATEFEYTVAFGGSLVGDDAGTLVGTTAGLEGTKTVTVETPTPGGGIDICQAVSSPTDVCKAGSAITSAGSLANAQGIVVDQSTGNVYVYENENNRVEVFSAKGVFEGAFGWRVKAGAEAAAALQFCTTAGTGCQAGETTASAGGFASNAASPRNLSIDSSGNLYVPDPGNARIDVFSPVLNGSNEVVGANFVRGIGWGVNANTPEDKLQECTVLSGCLQGTNGSGEGQFSPKNPTTVAVDSSGNIYAVSNADSNPCTTSAPCRIQKFNPNGTIANANFGPATGECATTRTSESPPASAFTTGPTGKGAQTVAVDPVTGHVFVLQRILGSAEQVCELDGTTGEVISISPPASMTLDIVAAAGLAVGTPQEPGAESRIYVANGAPAVYILGPVPSPGAEILPVTEVAQTTAKLNGNVTVPSPGGEGFNTVYHFEISADGGTTWAKVPASDVSVGSTAGTFEVNQTATGLQPNLNYRVRLVATTGPTVTSSEALFKTLAARPTVGSALSFAPIVTETTAKLKDFVNPNNSPTTYRFEWGTSTAYGNQFPDFEPFIGSGGETMTVTAFLTGLEPDTTYHYRLVATNTAGATVGEDRQFDTAAGRQELNSAGLPDGRRFELVSPPDKRPQGVVKALGGATFVTYQVAEDGQSSLFPILNGLEDTDSGGDTSYLATRHESGWQSTKISPPSLVPPPQTGGLGSASAGRVVYNSPDLSCGVINTFNPITADTPAADVELGVVNLYRRNPDGSHTLITSTVPANPGIPSENAGSGTPFVVTGASKDCSRIYFQSEYQYLPNPSGLYEWDKGTLRDAGRLPNGATPVGNLSLSTTKPAVFGGEWGANGASGSRVNSVSRDGSRSFFTALSNAGGDNGKPAVFVRKSTTETVDVSQKQGGANDSLGARYETASRDGSHVFFTANYGLTSASSSGPTEDCSKTVFGSVKACDLYDYEVENPVTHLPKLTDLSADTNPADTNGAAVNGVVAVSEDGSSVYFVARGQLVPGAGKTYAQNISGAGSANLYLARGGQLSYVATVAAADMNSSFGSGVLVRTGAWTAETSPDGHHLLFPSSANLTGYDSGGAVEAYLYSDTGAIQCVSCRPDGLPPVGGVSLLISSFPAGASQQSQPRKMSDDGSRVFFVKSDALAPGAVSGDRNLYEWERGQIYLLATDATAEGLQFYGASNSGNDVFFTTPQQLDPHDTDFVRDAYDARVGGGFPPPPTPATPCDPAADQCQGTPIPPPGASSPASQSFSGEGNPRFTPPRCPKGKVRKHGKCVPRKHPRCPKGKVRKHGKCVPRKHQRKKAQESSHRRAANTNRGGSK